MTETPVATHSFAAITVYQPAAESKAAGLDVSDVLARATAGPAGPLPHRLQLERRLGRSLAGVEAYFGPEARAALAWLGADAASIGHKIAFAEAHPDLATVAHEVTHVLQAQGEPDPGSDSEGIVERDSAAEREAEQVAGDIAASPELRPAAPLDVSGSLPAAGIALQRSGTGPPSPEGGLAVLERPIEPPRPATTDQPVPAPQPQQAETPAPSVGAGGAAPPVAAEGEPGTELTLPPAPEPGVSAEDVAVREAAVAEAEAVLAAARDAPALMQGFADAPPSLKASQQANLGARIGEVTVGEAAQFQTELPDFHATLSGEAETPAPLSVDTPETRDLTLEGTPPPPAPDPDIPATPDLGHFGANAEVGNALDLTFAGEAADRADAVGESLGDVQTTDPAITRSPGPPPAVPLEGESDPKRLANQATEGVAGARGARDEAHAAVLNGPGPEQAQPVRLDESYGVAALNTPVVAAAAPDAGAQTFLTTPLPPEVQVAFDQQQGPAMQASMAGAVAQADGAATARDEARQLEVGNAETEASRLSTEADGAQRAHVRDARATIQQERQTTLDAQTAAVTDMEQDVETRRGDDRQAIETRVADDQATIETRYQNTEREAEEKVAQGERDAEAEKRKAEEESRNASWWERAVNFVKSAFNALVSAINKVFDAVRSAINGLLDAVKSFAMGLIDAAASFIKGAIAAFGEFLKFAVDGLLGDIFPELAAALNKKIDGAVAAAQGFVDDVANGLKAGISALVEGLRAGLNRILDTFQAGLNVAIALVQAALTGDWSALARKLLEAALQVIGVTPEQFYAFVGRSEETFQLIWDDPLGFLSNLVDAFLGGVRLFAEKFGEHLQAGIIGWLTGAIGSANIALPERFDLWGVLDIARQILGLTWEQLREKAVHLVGEANVARLEYVASYIETLVTEGWSGLWSRIQNDLATVRDQVLEGIRSFLVERVIFAAVARIAMLFNPVGAVLQLLLAAWNLYTFLRDRFAQIMQVVQTVLDAIGDIARGVLQPAIIRVDQMLASLLPLALDLLARLLSLGNVGGRVREVVENIRATVDRAIDGLLNRVLVAFRGDRAAPTAAAPEGAAVPTTGQNVIDETFRVGGETHTLRAVIVEGTATLLMASERFNAMAQEMADLLENLRQLYTRPGGNLYDASRAAEREVAFKAIEDKGYALHQSLLKETDPEKERKAADKGIEDLKQMFNALDLPEARYDPLLHNPDGLPVDGFGRAKAFWGQPISAASFGKGSKPSVDPPGRRILTHVPTITQPYERGHLLAGSTPNSLGGPGNDLRNLVMISKDTNTAMRDGPEKDAREMIYEDPPNTPPTMFNYTASTEPGIEGPLVSLLTAIGAPLGGKDALFNVAKSNVDMSDAVLRTTLYPAGVVAPAVTPAQYMEVRKKLALAFLPSEINVTIGYVQGKTPKKQKYPPIANHLGETL